MSVQLEVIHSNPPQSEGDLRESILNNNNEIKKLATMIVKLIKLLLEEKISLEEFNKILPKYDNKLSSSLELRELYNKRIQEDSMNNIKELETVLENKELISVRKQIGDMQDEEYNLKLAAVNWDINKINKKTDYLKKCLYMLQTLSHKIEAEDANYISQITQDKYKAIKNTKLDADSKKRLTNNLKAISRIIS